MSYLLQTCVLAMIFVSPTAALAGPPGAPQKTTAPLAQVVPVGQAPSCARDGTLDDIWLVSSHGLSCLPRSELADPGRHLLYWRYDDECCRWQRSDRHEFFAAEPARLPTIVWVHGDRVDSSKAFHTGLSVYRQVLARAAGVTPVRFVIWSWPAQQERVGRPARDARIKAGRTTAAGYQLGWLLGQLDPQTPVSLIAFSFGARISTGALHLVAGGALAGHRLDVPAADVPRGYQLVLMAAALNCDWLRPGRPHGRALGQVQKLLLLNNHSDWVLRRYPRISCGPSALGYTGMNVGGSLAPYRDAICQINAGCHVGRRHRLDAYINSPTLVRQIRTWALSPAMMARKDASSAAASLAMRSDTAVPSTTPGDDP